MTLLASGAVQSKRLALALHCIFPRFPVRDELLRSPFDRLMLAWTPLAHVVHLTLSLLWPVLRRVRVPAYLEDVWPATWITLFPAMCGRPKRACSAPTSIRWCPPSATILPCCCTAAAIARCRLCTVTAFAALPRSQLILLADGHDAVL